MADNLDVKMAEVDQRARSNTRRIDKLEQSTDALHDLTAAVREMVTKQDYTTKQLDKLDAKVDGIDNRMDAVEQKPAKKWEGIVEKALAAIVGALVAIAMAAVFGT